MRLSFSLQRRATTTATVCNKNYSIYRWLLLVRRRQIHCWHLNWSADIVTHRVWHICAVRNENCHENELLKGRSIELRTHTSRARAHCVCLPRAPNGKSNVDRKLLRMRKWIQSGFPFAVAPNYLLHFFLRLFCIHLEFCIEIDSRRKQKKSKNTQKWCSAGRRRTDIQLLCSTTRTTIHNGHLWQTKWMRVLGAHMD